MILNSTSPPWVGPQLAGLSTLGWVELGIPLGPSVCGVHAVEVKTGRALGSLTWPAGNQIFAIDWINRSAATGFPFAAGARRTAREKALFYCYVN